MTTIDLSRRYHFLTKDNSLLYHNILISLNRHFIRPTPGFVLRQQSLTICIASADSIVAMLRQYQAQFGLRNCPIVLVYSAVAAASALLLPLPPSTAHPELDPRLKFLFRSLYECAETHDFAEEARRRLQKSMEKNTNLATPVSGRRPDQDHVMPSSAGAQDSTQDRDHTQPSPASPSIDWVLGGAFDFINPQHYESNSTTFDYEMSPLVDAFDFESQHIDLWYEELVKDHV